MNYITIDGGTTNTRLYLVQNGVITDTVRLSVGAGMGKDALAPAVRDGIAALLKKQPAVSRILASGMITSEKGLYELPHITAPAGIAELHNGMVEVTLPGITDIPFVFIPGVRSAGDLCDTDMMRGEETELVGMTAPAAGSMYILPGSHSKLIEIDQNGRICRFRTMLTGEMLAALSKNTILKDAVDMNASLNAELLLEGYRYCDTYGINEALFKVRILKNLFHAADDAVYSFFLGTVLHDEVKAIIANAPSKVIIGGKAQLKDAMCCLLEALCAIPVQAVSADAVAVATAYGAINIYEYLPENA